MASPSPVRAERRAEFAKAVHVISNAKGGIGKSFIASTVAQYLARRESQPLCMDADPSNQTFHRVAGLNVKPISLLEDGEIAPEKFDAMVEAALEHDGPAVIDTGSSGFFPFWAYVTRTDAFEILADNGHPAVIHVPIAAKPDLDDTLEGFGQICKLAPDHSVVAWLNQRDQRIELDGRGFADLPIARENERKLIGVVEAQRQLYGLHRDAVSTMIENGWTFDVAESSLGTMKASRIRQVREELFEELERIGI